MSTTNHVAIVHVSTTRAAHITLTCQAPRISPCHITWSCDCTREQVNQLRGVQSGHPWHLALDEDGNPTTHWGDYGLACSASLAAPTTPTRTFHAPVEPEDLELP